MNINMSGLNPFLTSNAPQHNLVPKVLSSVSGYTVAVDLVDIDTAYARQLGSTASPIAQEYVTQIGAPGSSGTAYFSDIYWQRFHPALPIGITGPTGPAGNSVAGGTGISVVTVGSVSTVSNTGLLGVTGSQYIGIDNTNPQFPVINFTGTTGFVQSVTGSTGISVNNTDPRNPVVSNTGILEIVSGSNVNIDTTDPQRPIINAGGGGSGGVPGGATGEIVFFTAIGIDSSANLKYDGKLNIASSTGTGKLKFGITGSNSIIESGSGGNGSGNLLEIGPLGAGTTGVYSTVTIDTVNSRLGINTVPTVELDVYGQTLLTGTDVESNLAGGSGTTGSFLLSPSTTYSIYVWGAGGSGNGGTGGAGGYSEVEITTGSVAQSLTWTQLYGGASGGGNATVVSYAGVPFIYTPGGGAGVTGGFGAAAGEPQGRPIPEGGRTAPGTTGSFAAYNISQSWSFLTVAGAVLPVNEIFNGGTIGGRISSVSGTAGMTLDFNYAGVVNPIMQTTTAAGTTYTVPPGITLTIESNNSVFLASTFLSLPNVTTTLPEGAFIAVDAGTSGVGGTGTAVYSGWPGVTLPNQFTGGVQLNTGATGISVGSGNVTWQSGSVVVGATGTTYSYFFTPGNVVTNTPANHVVVIVKTTTLTLPYSLPVIASGTITTSNPNQAIPIGTQINVVGSRVISYGQSATGSNGVNYGGGGYIGGGNSALITTLPQGAILTPGTSENEPAGGGAGSFFVQTAGIPDALDVQPLFDIGGSGIVPFVNRFNPSGFYGGGGMTGNPGYVVITQVISAPYALRVVGGEIVEAGDLEVFNGDIFTDQGIRGSFVSVSANNAPGGVINGIPTANGGKMMWNSLAAGIGRTEFLNAWGNGAGSGFAFYAGPNGSAAQPPAGTAQNLGFWDLNELAVVTPFRANQAAVTLGDTTATKLTASGIVRGSDLIATSDSRQKENIETIDSALDKVLRMRGVYFNRMNEEERRTGVIAQEVEDVLPEVVYTDDTEDKMKSVSYGSIVGLLIEAIKELSTRVQPNQK